MNRFRQQGLGAIVMGLVVALGQLPSLISVITNPTVSVFDQLFSIMMVIGAGSLLYLGIYHYRHPEKFDTNSTEYEFRMIPMAIIAVGLFGIGALLYLIVS